MGDKKVYYILEAKVETLIVLFQLEVTLKAQEQSLCAERVSNQLFGEYQAII